MAPALSIQYWNDSSILTILNPWSAAGYRHQMKAESYSGVAIKPYSLGINLFVFLDLSAAVMRSICPLLVVSDSILMAETTVSISLSSKVFVVPSMSR